MHEASYAAEGIVEIPVGKRHVALVDAIDGYLAEFSWYLDSGRQTPYAYRAVQSSEDGNWVRMHREIMGLQYRDPLQVDHINRNGLDNRRANLRVVTSAQQRHNMGAKRDKRVSQHRGVFLDRRSGRWYGQVQLNYKKHGTGLFDSEEEAAAAVQKLRKQVLSHATT